jgi:peptidoglycan hydrolase-like protein with peptidoglycan-binding domain
MIKKITFALVGAAVLVVPLLSSAATVGSSVAASVPAMPPISVIISGSACFPFSRSLSVGATGSDVTALQEFLSQQGYFNVSTTAYFGPITEAAVARWQASSGVVALDASGSGIFGPLSRGYFIRSCGGSNGGGGGSGGGTNTSTPAFSANPQVGAAPLTVQFSSTAAQGGSIGSAVNFGDGTSGTLGYVPVCSSCEARGLVSHTYTSAGTYTATLTSGTCTCPPGEVCNCPNIQILGTTTVSVIAPATSTTTSTTSSDIQLNAPGTVTLASGDIAEVRNESVYFTLENMNSSSATIQVTPVGCWNSFPSDPTPKVMCMIAMVPIPPQTLAMGQAYTAGNYSITLTQLTSSTATFSVGVK